jgi:predicted CXXCH cytochrome family protein
MRKIVVSLLSALALLLMFSVVAFAAAPAPTDIKLLGKDYNETTKKFDLRMEWQFVETAVVAPETFVGYKVYKNGTEVGTTTSKFFVVPDVTLGNTLEIAAVTNDGTANVVGAKASVKAPAWNALLGVGDVDNNIVNANQTGTGATDQTGNSIGDVIKSEDMVIGQNGTKGTQRTHGEYHNNSNSCASCHQTHTAASKSLLFKDGVYNTCAACHDGTLGFYNVFESHSDKGSAGTFGGTQAGNMSVHLANGTVAIKAAPGGNPTGTGTWAGEFNCASCHSPHGSYSDRLLHYNPNGMGIANKAEGGIGYKAQAITAGLPTTVTSASAAQIVVKDTAAALGFTADEVGGATDLTTVKVITVMDLESYKEGTETKYRYKRNKTPWLYGYGYGSPNKNYWTNFMVTGNAAATADKKIIVTGGVSHFEGVVDNHDQDWNPNLHFKWNKGYVYADNSDTILDNVTVANIARAYVVKLDLIDTGKEYGGVKITTVNQRALFAGELQVAADYDSAKFAPFVTVDQYTGAKTVAGLGVAMSGYCAACHTDYLAKSGAASGTFDTTSYRHTTNSDTYTCVRCHFAHGTDVTVMRDANGNDIEDLIKAGMTEAVAKDYLLDKNPSSALKRYTNMAVCWGCHTDSKAEQLKNTGSYDKSVDPHGLETEEGTYNWTDKSAN